MKIRLVSDLHLEICPYFLPIMEGESEQVLVLAGDICTEKQLNSTVTLFFETVVQRFKHILWVPGNHEYYRRSLDKADDKIKEYLKDNLYSDKITFLNMETICIDDYAFIGATLWTDINKGNPISIHSVESALNDYQVIRTGGDGYLRSIKASDTIAKHIRHKAFIINETLAAWQDGKKPVVISHHAPSELSVAPWYKGDYLNPAYFSNMENEILDTKPVLWMHGHMHNTFDYELGDTRVVCNPRGYSKIAGSRGTDLFNKQFDHYEGKAVMTVEEYLAVYMNENASFDPYLVIEI